jgi:hypothetical protein
MYTCTYAHMHTCTHVHMHICTYAHMHTCTRAHMHTDTYTHTTPHSCEDLLHYSSRWSSFTSTNYTLPYAPLLPWLLNETKWPPRVTPHTYAQKGHRKRESTSSQTNLHLSLHTAQVLLHFLWAVQCLLLVTDIAARDRSGQVIADWCHLCQRCVCYFSFYVARCLSNFC